MPLTTMVIIMFYILIFTGVFEEVRKNIELPKFCLYYFLLCCAALYGFNAVIIPEVEINPACFVVLISAATLAACQNEGRTMAVIPIAALLSIPTVAANLFFKMSEPIRCLVSMLPALCIFSKRNIGFNLAVAASAPFIAAIVRFVIELNLTGYGSIAFDKSIVDMQFIGLFAVCAAEEIKAYVKKRSLLRIKQKT